MSYALCAAGVMMVGTAVSAKMSSDASNAATARAVGQNTYEGNLQKGIKKIESEEMIATSKVQAGKILDQARYVRSAQMAQMAGGGVMVGEGSAQVMQDRTTELAMQDALAALYSGARGSVSNDTQGRFALQRANNASAGAIAQNESTQNAIMVNAATTIVSTGIGAYGKSITPAKP